MFNDFSDDSEVPMPSKGLGAPREQSSDSEGSDENIDEDCGSSEEDYENGNLFKKLKRDCNQAKHERQYLMETLKAKSRVGSIFYDQVRRVIAAV